MFCTYFVSYLVGDMNGGFSGMGNIVYTTDLVGESLIKDATERLRNSLGERAVIMSINKV